MNRKSRTLAVALAAIALLLGNGAWAADFCTGAPPLRLEKGPYTTPSFALTGAEFDAWLTQVRERCASYTVATLPTCNSAAKGWTSPVTDSTTGCSVGGGSGVTVCLCNGTTWGDIGGSSFAGTYSGTCLLYTSDAADERSS